jgi:toxin YoeB
VNRLFTERGWARCLHWQATDKAMLRGLNALIEDCLRHPFDGIGAPEPLRGDLAGFWSRRIDREHRLVYRASPGALEIVQRRSRYRTPRRPRHPLPPR